mmetsp:Transcript_6102/g.14173  ORF Transcript_6102/g.14173 Transcript_6102/m.14173 type:complete len:206 (+) Transcript_6102:1677-2294(+)
MPISVVVRISAIVRSQAAIRVVGRGIVRHHCLLVPLSAAQTQLRVGLHSSIILTITSESLRDRLCACHSVGSCGGGCDSDCNDGLCATVEEVCVRTLTASNKRHEAAQEEKENRRSHGEPHTEADEKSQQDQEHDPHDEGQSRNHEERVQSLKEVSHPLTEARRGRIGKGLPAEGGEGGCSCGAHCTHDLRGQLELTAVQAGGDL